MSPSQECLALMQASLLHHVVLLRTPSWVLKCKAGKQSTMILRPNLTNPARVMYTLCFLHDPHVYHHLSSIVESPSPLAPACLGQPLSYWLGQHHLRCLLMYTCSLMLPIVSHPGCTLAPRSLGPSLHVHSSLLRVHRHELAWPSPMSPTISMLNTWTHHEPRDMLTSLHSHHG